MTLAGAKLTDVVQADGRLAEQLVLGIHRMHAGRRTR